MKKLLTAILCLAILGCGSKNEDIPASTPAKNTPDTKQAGSVAKEVSYGAFEKNGSIMTIKDVFSIWVEEENKLKIYQTPSQISVAEKERIKNGETEFFIFSSKESPDKSKWQWYPYVVTELRFKSNSVSRDNIENFYIMAYGIEKANYTDNITSYPDENTIFAYVKYEPGNLTVEYSGKYTMMDSEYNWHLKK